MYSIFICLENKKTRFLAGFKSSNINIISNYSAESTDNISVIINNLSKQMSNKVRWVESIKTLEQLKEENIIEIGPGKVLSGLIKRISKKFKLINFNDINDIVKIKNETATFSDTQRHWLVNSDI